MQVKIFSHKTSPRLHYILDEIFTNQLHVEYELINDQQKFESEKGVKINYSSLQFDDSLNIIPTNLLFENDIKAFSIETTEWNNRVALFKVENQLLPFDIFAACFYLLSRYEEYILTDFDQFGRFKAKNSLAFQNSFLEIPLINFWLKDFSTLLNNLFPEFIIPSTDFSFTPTVDIDNAFAFKHKGLARTTMSLLKKLFSLQFNYLGQQIKVLNGKLPDPYDTFNLLKEVHSYHNLNPIYFLLVGKYNKYDTNLPIDNSAFQKLIREVNEYATIGLHPSFKSNQDIAKLQNEKKYLENLIGKKIIHSRNHYLILNLPETYEHLVSIGIEHDYSMGYSELPGFRASISTPFKFYNLKQDSATNLTIHPFAFMDATFKYYLNQSPEESLKIIETVISNIKSIDGNLISLWHNESLSNFRIWENWRQLYSEMINYAAK